MPAVDLTPYYQPPATGADGTKFDNALAYLQTIVNGLDASNWAAGKIFDPLKLTQDGAVAGQALVWNAAANGGSGGWVPGNATPGVYRKTTAKQVVNTVAETDLLNGEITVAAGVIGASGVLRLSAYGDLVNNSGAPIGTPRFKLKLGATTLLDTNTVAAGLVNTGARTGWRINATIANLGATNSQWATIDGSYLYATASALIAFTTGEGFHVSTLVAGGGGPVTFIGGNAGAIDTTAAQALALTVINAVANAAIDVTLKGALVEVL